MFSVVKVYPVKHEQCGSAGMLSSVYASLLTFFLNVADEIHKCFV